MKSVIVFVVTFLIIYLVYLVFVINRKKSLANWQNGKEMRYLKSIYKLKIKKDNLKDIAYVVALTNSFIVATTVLIISLLNNFFIQMLAGFLILCVLIVISYHLIGKYYQKKGMR